MAIKSILELEEARRRLDRMTEDHQQIAELMSKLKGVRDALTTTLQDAHSRLENIDTQSQRAKKQIADTAALIDEFRQQAATALTNLNSFKKAAETGLKVSTDAAGEKFNKMSGELDGAITEMQRQFVALADINEKRFSVFRTQHDEAIRSVREAYERARGTLDSHAPLFDRLDAKVDNLIRGQTEAAMSLQTELNGCNSRLNSIPNLIREEIAASQKKLIERTASELQRVSVAQDQCVTQVRSLTRLLKYGMLIILMVAGICAGTVAISAYRKYFPPTQVSHDDFE